MLFTLSESPSSLGELRNVTLLSSHLLECFFNSLNFFFKDEAGWGKLPCGLGREGMFLPRWLAFDSSIASAILPSMSEYQYNDGTLKFLFHSTKLLSLFCFISLFIVPKILLCYKLATSMERSNCCLRS
ncbi:MAG TPA: hypothetical protein V6D20_11165, partial [Candidatus Obscuribacterales bacterium]